MQEHKSDFRYIAIVAIVAVVAVVVLAFTFLNNANMTGMGYSSGVFNGTIEIGYFGEEYETGYIKYIGADNETHKLPVEIKNLVSTTASGAGRVFTFGWPPSNQDYYYEFRTDDQRFALNNGDRLNGIAVTVGNSNNKARVRSASNVGRTNCNNVPVGGECIINDIRYAVVSVDSQTAVTLDATGMLKMVQGTTVTQTSMPVPFNLALNNAIYLDGKNPFIAYPVELREGVNNNIVKYVPLLVDNANLKSGFLVLAKQQFGANGNRTIYFDGTSIPAANNEDDDLSDPTDKTFYVPDNRNFTGGVGQSSALGGSTPIAADQTDNAYFSAIFRVKEISGGNIWTVLVDTKDNRLVDVLNPEFAEPDYQAKYKNNNKLVFPPTGNYPATYTNNLNSEGRVDGSMFYLFYYAS